MAQGRLQESLEDLRIAVRLARAWRWSTPADEAGRLGAEGLLDQVYSALIEAGNRLYQQTHDPALIRETFEAAEENRAVSLQSQVFASRAGADLPPAQWEALLRLQRAEVEALRNPASATRDSAAAARAEVARLDAATPAIGFVPPQAVRLAARVQSALDDRTALLSFHLGEASSWMWAVDRSSIALYQLPPAAEIQSQIRSATRALAGDEAGAAPVTATLYRTLFGGLTPRFRSKARWLLALDQGGHFALTSASPAAPGLFDVPMAALAVQVTSRRTVFVAESHSTVVIPGAGFWLASAARPGASHENSLFVGVGDAIYNTADPRFPAPRTPPPIRPRPFVAFAATRPLSLALPRLVASAAELDACARAWNGDGVLLKGRDASRENLEQQMRRNPAVLHFATHFLPSSGGPASGQIALSLNPRGESELLGPAEIARWRVDANLVVLSGCRSAEGAVLPGAGLLGLTRAWLAAGAHSVIASRWKTPDDSGALFSALYRNLRTPGHPGAADALRSAQVEMIRSGGWRARPSYWGAYLAVGDR